ncbi:MAG: aromatic ring-hydroxylating dioxygenase subunit alpha, partial [Candidatus Eisenbacteria bacterium]
MPAPPFPFSIDPDIRRAATLPARVYHDPALFEHAREAIFARSWQVVADTAALRAPGTVLPATFLEGACDEPLLLTRDTEDRLSCLSNVCTHRGNLLVTGAGALSQIRCRYHGRRFGLDGRFVSMPEFEAAVDFPRPEDDLPRLATATWGPFVFAALDPLVPFDDWIAPLRDRLAGLDFTGATLAADRSRDYLVRAHWALYLDNYLEGFHIPYVHASLAEVVDYGTYRSELFPHGVLQVGLARGAEERFALSAASPDAGQAVAAYWFWLWPNTMLNVYPWGISLNVVKPLAVDRTKVTF